MPFSSLFIFILMDSQYQLDPTTSSHKLMSLLLLFSVSVFLLLCKKSRERVTSKLPPGPRKLPIIGNLHQLGATPHRSLHKLSQKHGPLMFLKLGSAPTVVISSSDVAREVFKSHDLAFSGRPSLYAAKKLSYNLSDMAFAPYGEYWRQVRKVSVIELLSLKRVHSFRAVREKEVALLMASIERSASCSVTINLSELMLSLANNTVSQVMFGEKYGGSSYDEGRSKFHGVLEEVQSLLGGFCVADYLPWLEWIERFTGLKKRLEKNFEELDGFYDQVIEDHSNKKREKDDDYVEDLVDVLLRLRKDPEYRSVFSSMNCIKGLMTDLFIAGTDTSSATIVWTMTELIRNPTVMIKVQEELQTVIGDKTRVQESDLKQLAYMKLVIKEALRMHPPAPLLVLRETTEPCSIKGYTIPSKTRVCINAQGISMDPAIWKSPAKFWPERFLDNDIDFRGQDFSLIPFGSGRRVCPGINFAVVQIELALANLLHCFDWKLPEGMEIEDLDMEEAIGITMHKKVPLCLVPKHKQYSQATYVG